jgi:hypothetical protein
MQQVLDGLWRRALGRYTAGLVVLISVDVLHYQCNLNICKCCWRSAGVVHSFDCIECQTLEIQQNMSQFVIKWLS